MKKLLSFLILMNSAILIAQTNTISDLDRLEHNKQEIIKMLDLLNDSLKNIDKKIEKIKTEILSNQFQNSMTIAKVKIAAKVRQDSNPESPILSIIPVGDSVNVLDFYNGYWGINKDSIYGYVNSLYLIENEVMKAVQEKHYQEQTEQFNLSQAKSKQDLINQIGEKNYNRIINGEYWIGMTSTLARMSLGNPLKINKSVGSWGVHEQWIYKNLYLYFENRILTSYQEEK